MTISDRTKDVIKSGGEWISSVELENAVMAHPDVFEAAVIAIPDPKWSERPLVAVVPKPGRTPAPADLLDFLVGRVPRWWLPDQWTFVDRDPQDERREVRQEGHAGRLRRRRVHGAAHAAAPVSGDEAVAELAERLDGVLEELTDMALDALRLASAGDPDSAETGEALALEKRIVKARRALERCVAALRGGSGLARPPRRRRLIPPARMRTFVAAWPDEPTRRRLAALELGHAKNLRQVGPTRWHVTLRFLGEVTEEEVGLLGPALQARRGRAPRTAAECRLGPATAWFSRVRVLQLPAHGLDELAAVVAGATAPSCPSGTAAARPSTATSPWPGSRDGWGPRPRPIWQGIPFDSTFAVEHVDLVASEPSPQGHVYTTLRRAPLGSGLTQAGPAVRSVVMAWAMAAAAACWKDGVTSRAASVALRMLPHSMSTLGTVVRLRPARSLRGCRPSIPS